ncbi:site-2 protease family protein [Candidatus Parcubacteria bacterium]|nr:site-2 protease family protein [Candidatus Parcubacteria bacterium]
MSILIFIIILVVLIVVHELGHFLVAKWSGMRVEEFGIGYPPRALTLAKKDGTEYTLNWLPFGGFVRIYGEDGEEADADSFVSKPHLLQALTLIAGIAMNLLLAWVLLSITLGLGMPRVLSDAEAAGATDAKLIVSEVLPGSPAFEATLMRGDVITKAFQGDEELTDIRSGAFTSFIAESTGEPITLLVEREGEEVLISAAPQAGVIASEPERLALGVGVASVGTVPVSWWQAPIEGFLLTWSVTGQVAVGLTHFFIGLFTLTADLSQVSGPLGIAGAVGEASNTGLIALLTLTAVISINLALINVLPIPALDGGRLLFVLIEWVTRKRIPKSVSVAFNGIGFAALILLMLVVTASDVLKLLS